MREYLGHYFDIAAQRLNERNRKMFSIQQAEHEQYEHGAFDKFEGFDRGDLGASDEEPTVKVLARQRTAAGRLVLERIDELTGTWFGLTLGDKVLYAGENEDEARTIARQHLN